MSLIKRGGCGKRWMCRRVSGRFSGKKGQIESQFNWIFVFMVGAVILLFFIKVVTTQKAFAEEKLSLNVLNRFETMSSGAVASKGTAQEITVPDRKIEYGCPDCKCEFWIGSKRKEYRDKIIFAPSYTQGKTLLVWSQGWSLPYRITNFLYLTSPDSRYVLVVDNPGELTGVERMINETLPVNMFFETKDNDEVIGDGVKDLKNDKLRFILVEEPDGTAGCDFQFPARPTEISLVNIEDMEDEDVTALRICTSDGYQGELTFYQKNGDVFEPSEDVVSGATLPFLGREMMFGGIFADDIELYGCNALQAFDKMKQASTTYKKKVRALYDFSRALPSEDDMSICFGYYESAEDSFVNINHTIYTNLPNRDLDIYLTHTYAAQGADVINTIASEAGKITTQNNYANQQSCPMIY